MVGGTSGVTSSNDWAIGVNAAVALVRRSKAAETAGVTLPPTAAFRSAICLVISPWALVSWTPTASRLVSTVSNAAANSSCVIMILWMSFSMSALVAGRNLFSQLVFMGLFYGVLGGGATGGTFTFSNIEVSPVLTALAVASTFWSTTATSCLVALTAESPAAANP